MTTTARTNAGSIRTTMGGVVSVGYGIGCSLAFVAAPTMTVGHLLFVPLPPRPTPDAVPAEPSPWEREQGRDILQAARRRPSGGTPCRHAVPRPVTRRQPTLRRSRRDVEADRALTRRHHQFDEIEKMSHHRAPALASEREDRLLTATRVLPPPRACGIGDGAR
jgi:hypothetical protein